MNKSIIFITILVGLLVFSACTQQETSANSTTEVNTSTEVKANVDAKVEVKTDISDTLGNILKMSGKFKCEYNSNEAVQSAVLYVEKGNYRMDTKTEQGEIHSVSKFDSNGVCSFSWGNVPGMADSAIKFCLTKEQLDQAKGMAQQNNQANQPTTETNVKCEPYTGNIDFNVPSNLKVVDSTQLAANYKLPSY